MVKLLFQFPEGLKPKANQLIKEYLTSKKIKNAKIYISSSPTFGACDLSLTEAAMIGANKIIHYGHSKFVKHDLPIDVEYIEYHLDVRLDKFADEVSKIKEKRIALGTTVQHIHQIELFKSILEENKKSVFIGKGIKTTYPGQLLGCDSVAITSILDKCDAVLIVGTGIFHMLPIDTSGKNVYVYSPSSNNIRLINEDIKRWSKKKKGNLVGAIEAKSIGILVSTKIGQYNFFLAEKIKAELEKMGKHANIIVGDNITPDTLINFGYDAYITTACPRLVDDTDAVDKPILDIQMYLQLKEILGKTKKPKKMDGN